MDIREQLVAEVKADINRVINIECFDAMQNGYLMVQIYISEVSNIIVEDCKLLNDYIFSVARKIEEVEKTHVVLSQSSLDFNFLITITMKKSKIAHWGIDSIYEYVKVIEDIIKKLETGTYHLVINPISDRLYLQRFQKDGKEDFSQLEKDLRKRLKNIKKFNFSAGENPNDSLHRRELFITVTLKK